MNSRVQLSLAGFEFDGLLTDDGRPSQYTYLERTCRAISKTQVFIDQEVETSGRFTSASSLLSTVLGDSGVTGTVVGDDRTVQGYAFKGKASDGLQYLAQRGKYMLYIGPTGVKMIDRDNPEPSPLDFDVSNPFGFDKLNKSFQQARPVNEVVINGGVPKESDDDEDNEERTIEDEGNGTKAWFSLPNTTDRVTDIRVNGESVTVTDVGDPDQETADCVWYPTEYQLKFNTPPASGATIEIDIVIERAKGRYADTAKQSQFASEFGGSGRVVHIEDRPEVRTQAEADEYAENLAATLTEDRVEVQVEKVWGAPS